jgi:hypothetical protein
MYSVRETFKDNCSRSITRGENRLNPYVIDWQESMYVIDFHLTFLSLVF